MDQFQCSIVIVLSLHPFFSSSKILWTQITKNKREREDSEEKGEWRINTLIWVKEGRIPNQHYASSTMYMYTPQVHYATLFNCDTHYSTWMWHCPNIIFWLCQVKGGPGRDSAQCIKAGILRNACCYDNETFEQKNQINLSQLGKMLILLNRSQCKMCPLPTIQSRLLVLFATKLWPTHKHVRS